MDSHHSLGELEAHSSLPKIVLQGSVGTRKNSQAGNDTARLAMISTFKQLEKLEKEMMQVFFEGSETISRLGASQKCVNLQSAQDPPHTPGDHVCAVCFILL